MKSLLLAAVLAATASGVRAQFNPPDAPMQRIDVSAGAVANSRSQTGSPGALSASARDAGLDGSGRPFSVDASGSTRIGPGRLSGSLATRFAGTGGGSASLSAYQHDAMTFRRLDGGPDSELIVHYNIVIAGGSSASIDPVSPSTSGGDAGSLDWTFVHRLDNFYLTSWDSTTRLGYDGSVMTTSHWNVGEIGQVYAVYSFSAAVLAGSAVDLDLYLEMNSRLNAAGIATAGSLSADAPTIYWGGISQVTDWFGNRLDYTVSSASGFNYALSAEPSPAPEPASWAMSVLGGLALVLWLRQRRSRGADTVFSSTPASTTHSTTAGG